MATMQPVGDMPTINAANYANSSVALSHFSPATAAMQFGSRYIGPNQETIHLADQALADQAAATSLLATKKPFEKEIVMPVITRRLVQVFIADPDENVPTTDCMIYSGEQRLTDLTDQELYFEIDIKGALTTYNEKRTKIINKKVKDRTEYLEAVRVRDLKMTVVEIAKF